MTHFRYVLLLIITCLITLVSYSQTLTTVSNHTVFISPSYTINSGANYTVTGEVKNIGISAINNNVHVNVAIDTSSIFGTPKYYWRVTKTYSVTSFAPNNTFAFSVSDAATTLNGYKTSGNGVTVVVWTSVGLLPNELTTTLDSVFTTIYILPLPQGIEQLELLQNELDKLPNPLQQNIQFTNTENWTIELVDMIGKINQILNSEFRIQNYGKGLYLLRVRNKNGRELCKKIIIN